jgi:2,4-dienoyl-CoA reductase-like NADH-dependent reductase (Old Yellow Enzyme family)
VSTDREEPKFVENRAAHLLSRPITVGGLTLPNRVAMAPMTRGFSPGGVPGADVAAYYPRRAAGGTGLVITEGAYVGHPSAGQHDLVSRMYGDDALAGWARVTAAVHDAGGRIFAQLQHVGMARQAGDPPHPEAPAIGPSGQPLEGTRTGHALTQADIDAVLSAFAEAARDGGDVRARARFAAEAVAAVRARVAPGFPVVVRLSQWKQSDYTARLADTPEEFGVILGELVDAGADAFHASTRRYWQPAFDGAELNLAGWAKKLTGKPAITVGSVGLDTEFTASLAGDTAGRTGIDGLLDRLEADEFDVVAVGRSLLADPDRTAKILGGRDDDVVPFTLAALGVLG